MAPLSPSPSGPPIEVVNETEQLAEGQIKLSDSPVAGELHAGIRDFPQKRAELTVTVEVFTDEHASHNTAAGESSL